MQWLEEFTPKSYENDTGPINYFNSLKTILQNLSLKNMCNGKWLKTSRAPIPEIDFALHSFKEDAVKRFL